MKSLVKRLDNFYRKILWELIWVPSRIEGALVRHGLRNEYTNWTWHWPKLLKHGTKNKRSL